MRERRVNSLNEFMPSETTAMITMIEQPRVETGVSTWLNQICAEYREMPGLSLTQPQMQRLWGFEPHVCAALVDSLVAAHVLRCTPRGRYVRFEA
jgi:hypothetical protein